MEKVPALITNPFDYGAFILSDFDVPPQKRTFYVAFPGYEVGDVPKTRNVGIKNAQNKKIMAADGCLNEK